MRGRESLTRSNLTYWQQVLGVLCRDCCVEDSEVTFGLGEGGMPDQLVMSMNEDKEVTGSRRV